MGAPQSGADVAAKRLPGPVVAIAGPTASGKTSLAHRIARVTRGPVVSTDAMQVYRGMDVGTAKEREPSVELRMTDVVDIADDYSVSLYQRGARSCVDDALSQGVVPVLCGGTGLYLDAVIDEMSFPAGGLRSDARIRWESFAREHGDAALHDELARRDPASAALVHPHNVRRVIRALEMSELGVSYAGQNRGLHRRIAHYDAHVFAITMDRERLYGRIDARVDAMFEQGLVAEVEALASHGLRMARTARQAIGYKEVLEHLDGGISLDEAASLMKLRTRRYAKRQISWLRRRQDVTWLDADRLDEDAAARIVLDSVRGVQVIAPVDEGR